MARFTDSQNNYVLNGIATPLADTDAANKKYVDDNAGAEYTSPNSTLNIDNDNETIDVDTSNIATRDYVDFEFIENSSYTNINDDLDFTYTVTNSNPSTDSEVRVGSVGHFRQISFHGHLNEDLNFTGAFLKITISDSTGYYAVAFAPYESSDDTTHIYLSPSTPITGDDVLASATAGNEMLVEHDTDASGVIHIGYGLTHDSDGLLIVDTDEIATRDFAVETAVEAASAPTNHLSYQGVVDSTATNIALSLGTNFNMNENIADNVDVAIYGPIRSGPVFDSEFFEDTEVSIGSSTLRGLKYIADTEALVSVNYSHSVRINYSGSNVNYDNGHLNLLLIDSENRPASVLVQNDDASQHSVLARSNTPHYHTGGSGSGSIGTFHGGYLPLNANNGDILLFAWTFRTDGANNTDWHVNFNNGHNHSLLGIEVEVQFDGDFASLTLDSDGTLLKRTHFGDDIGTVEIADTDFVKAEIAAQDHSDTTYTAGTGLNLVDTEFSVDEDVIATTDYVDGDFVIGFNYTNINDNDTDFVSVASPTNANDVFIDFGSDYFVLQMRRDDLIYAADTHKYFKITSNGNVGYYEALSHHFGNIVTINLVRPHVAGDQVLPGAVGDTFTIEVDTDAANGTIKLGFGLTHDSEEIVVDTEVIADTDYVKDHVRNHLNDSLPEGGLSAISSGDVVTWTYTQVNDPQDLTDSEFDISNALGVNRVRLKKDAVAGDIGSWFFAKSGTETGTYAILDIRDVANEDGVIDISLAEYPVAGTNVLGTALESLIIGDEFELKAARNDLLIGGGSDQTLTAGTGINISDADVISVDTTTIATRDYVDSDTPLFFIDINSTPSTDSEANASGADSIAIGSNANTDGVNSIAIGINSSADGTNSTTVGENAHADTDYSMAFGYHANANAQHSVALGYNATADNDDEIRLGDSGASVRIHPSAAGGQAHDNELIDVKYFRDHIDHIQVIASDTDERNALRYHSTATGDILMGLLVDTPANYPADSEFGDIYITHQANNHTAFFWAARSIAETDYNNIEIDSDLADFWTEQSVTGAQLGSESTYDDEVTIHNNIAGANGGTRYALYTGSIPVSMHLVNDKSINARIRAITPSPSEPWAGAVISLELCAHSTTDFPSLTDAASLQEARYGARVLLKSNTYTFPSLGFNHSNVAHTPTFNLSNNTPFTVNPDDMVFFRWRVNNKGLIENSTVDLEISILQPGNDADDDAGHDREWRFRTSGASHIYEFDLESTGDLVWYDEDNDTSHTIFDASESKVPTEVLGGTNGSSSNFLRGDGTWATVPGSEGGETHVAIAPDGAEPSVGDNATFSINIGGANDEITDTEVIFLGRGIDDLAPDSTDIKGTVAIGALVDVAGRYNIAIGRNAKTAEGNAIAIGGDNAAANAAQALQQQSIAIGHKTLADGNQAIAIGETATADSDQAVAIGRNINDTDSKTGSQSVAMGATNKALEIGAISIGSNNTAKGRSAMAIGRGNEATHTDAVAIGDNVHVRDSDAVAIGVGINLESGATGAIAIGKSITSAGQDSVSIGEDANADTDEALAIGKDVLSRAYRGIAFGSNSEVTQDGRFGVAIGSGTEGGGDAGGARVSGQEGVAIGHGARAGERGVAIGSAALAEANQVDLGGPLIETVLITASTYDFDDDNAVLRRQDIDDYASYGLNLNTTSFTGHVFQVDTDEIATRQYVRESNNWVSGLDSDDFAVIHHDTSTNSYTPVAADNTPSAGQVGVFSGRLVFRNAELNMLEISNASILNVNTVGSLAYYRIDEIRMESEYTTIYYNTNQLGQSSTDTDAIGEWLADNSIATFFTIYADIKDKTDGEKFAAVLQGTVGASATVGGNSALTYTMQGGTYYRRFVSGGEELRVLSSDQTDPDPISHTFLIASKTY